MTKKDFIYRSRKIHGNKFDYTNVIIQRSNEKVAIICPIHGEFYQTIEMHLSGRGCEKCRKMNMASSLLVDEFPEIYKELNQELSRLPDYLPSFEYVGSKSNKTMFWTCARGHNYKTSPSQRVGGRGCPYCSNHRPLSGYNTLKDIYPEIAAEWDFEKNYPLRPDDILPKSGKKVYWKCSKGHSWSAMPLNRIREGSGCPYCSGRLVLTGENDLETLYPDIASEWDLEKNKIKPSTIMPQVGKQFWWRCKNGHSYKATPNARVGSGTGCPFCKQSAGAQMVEKVLEENGVIFVKEYTFPDLKDVLKLRFDFMILDANQKCVGEIEFHGAQHYKPSTFGKWTTDEAEEKYAICKKHDDIKSVYLKNHRIPQLIIPYTQQNDIRNIVEQFIQEISYQALEQRRYYREEQSANALR